MFIIVFIYNVLYRIYIVNIKKVVFVFMGMVMVVVGVDIVWLFDRIVKCF